MKQIITVNFGQPGINIAEQTLSLYAQEHQLTSNPPIQTPTLDPHPFFRESSQGHLTGRTLSVDCDRSAIESVLTGPNRQFYHPDQLVGTWSSSGSVFSKAQSIAKAELLERFADQFRKAQEQCDNLQGVVFNGCTLGGSAGLIDAITTKLTDEHWISKIPKIGYLLYPSRDLSNSLVQVYNHTLASNCLLNYMDLVIPFDNQSLYSAAHNHLDIEAPGFQDINRVIAQVQSAVSLSMREQAQPLNVNFRDLLTNLVCYPRIHYLYPSLAGLPGDIRNPSIGSIDQLTRKIFDPSSHLHDMHKVQNKIAVALFFRGHVEPFEVAHSAAKIKEEVPPNCVFEEWSPLGFKYTVSRFRAKDFFSSPRRGLVSASCLGLINSMEFTFPIGHSNHKFDLLYSKRVFVHHYSSAGLEEMELVEARQDLAALQKDYEPCRCCEMFQQEQEQNVEQ